MGRTSGMGCSSRDNQVHALLLGLSAAWGSVSYRCRRGCAKQGCCVRRLCEAWDVRAVRGYSCWPSEEGAAVECW